MKSCCSPFIRVSARGLYVSHHLMPHQWCLMPQRCHVSPGITALQSQPPALGKKGRGAHLPSLSLTQAPVTGDKSHLLHNSQCLEPEGIRLGHALMVLWESPLGQEETLPGAAPLEGLAEGHIIYVGLKCTGLTQGSQQSLCLDSSQVKPSHRVQGGTCWCWSCRLQEPCVGCLL